MSIQTSSIDRHELDRWKTSHILGLDSLRGILSIIVLYAHTYQIFITPLEVGGHSTFGYANGILARCAVLCFFVLSGHVITLSIDSNYQKNGRFDLFQYLGSRFFRIVPPLLVVFCLTLIASLIIKNLNASSVSAEFSARKFYITDILDQIRSLLTLCTSGDLTGKGLNGPLWTLTYEIQLYIISGLLACVIF
jgi:peptidoglycan/LPS O-acetylase OafA/YrhL